MAPPGRSKSQENERWTDPTKHVIPKLKKCHTPSITVRLQSIVSVKSTTFAEVLQTVTDFCSIGTEAEEILKASVQLLSVHIEVFSPCLHQLLPPF